MHKSIFIVGKGNAINNSKTPGIIIIVDSALDDHYDLE